MANGTTSGFIGAGSGAFQGGLAGGLPGALAGGLIGGLAGAFGGGGESEGLSRGDIEFLLNQRQQQIDAFRDKLADIRARSRVLIENARGAAEQRFREKTIPNIEAQFAGRGLQVTGGAFQSELAKRLADIEFQNQQAKAGLLDQERRDVAAVAGQAVGPSDIASLFTQASQREPNQLLTGLGEFSGQLATAGFQDFLARRRIADQPRKVIGGPIDTTLTRETTPVFT